MSAPTIAGHTATAVVLAAVSFALAALAAGVDLAGISELRRDDDAQMPRSVPVPAPLASQQADASGTRLTTSSISIAGAETP